MQRFFEFLRRALDPRGPLGEVLSPADVFKERAGLPIAAPHSVRAEFHTDAVILETSRFIAFAHAVDVPISRIRQISAFVEEVWEPVYAKTNSTDPLSILRASETVVGWNVTQRKRNAFCDCTHAHFEKDGTEWLHRTCGRARRKVNAEEFQEILASMQVIPTDDFYNQYLDTVPGNDPVILNGEVLHGEAVYELNPDGSRGKLIHDGTIRGGTQIRHGRREYREKVEKAGFVHWDKGFLKERERAMAEEAAAPVRNVRAAMEEIAATKLPMWNPTGINFRRDRRSAV